MSGQGLRGLIRWPFVFLKIEGSFRRVDKTQEESLMWKEGL